MTEITNIVENFRKQITIISFKFENVSKKYLSGVIIKNLFFNLEINLGIGLSRSFILVLKINANF